MSKPTMFELHDVCVAFGPEHALEPTSLSLHAGTTVALMGPNGSGKTTLLRVIAELQKPSSGSLDSDPSSSIAYVGQHQHHHTWMPLTVREVLGMGRYRTLGLFGRFRNSDRDAMHRAADRLDVTTLLERPFGELSGGQRQRVLVASAIANDAMCLLLDEPITGLDLPSQQIILDVIDSERERGRLVILSTHHLEEARHCDRVLLLNGKVIADGPPVDVLTEANLTAAFGQSVLRVAGTSDDGPPVIVLDDHGHGHDHAHSSGRSVVHIHDEIVPT